MDSPNFKIIRPSVGIISLNEELELCSSSGWFLSFFFGNTTMQSKIKVVIILIVNIISLIT